MRSQDNRGGELGKGVVKVGNPFSTIGSIPLPLQKALAQQVLPFPMALSMIGTGIPYPWKNQDFGFWPQESPLRLHDFNYLTSIT